MRRCAAALARRIGRRGATLLFFGCVDLVFAFSLFVPPRTAPNATMMFVAAILPLPVWGTLWLAAGIVVIINAFRLEDRLGFTAAIAIKTLWGALFTYATVTGAVERAYLSAFIWLALAALLALISTWPEPVISAPGKR